MTVVGLGGWDPLAVRVVTEVGAGDPPGLGDSPPPPHACVLHSRDSTSGPHPAKPTIRARVWYCMPPPQVREQAPQELQGPNVQPETGQDAVLPMQGWASMKAWDPHAGQDCWRVGGREYRTLVR